VPRRSPWKKAIAVGSVALTGLGALFLFGRKKEPEPIGRVALIGDSYAVGLGPALKGGLVLKEFMYEGHIGASTSRYRTLPIWLIEYKPRIVLVSLGVNEADSSTLANYQSIVRALHGIGARVVWIEPPAAVQTASRAMIAALGVQTVPATTTPLAADGLHPRNYREWAGEIEKTIGVVRS